MNKVYGVLLQLHMLIFVVGVDFNEEKYEAIEQLLSTCDSVSLMALRYDENTTKTPHEELGSKILGDQCSHELWTKLVEPSWTYQGNNRLVNHYLYNNDIIYANQSQFFRNAFLTGLRLEIWDGPVCHHKERFAVKCGKNEKCECDSKYYREVNKTCLGLRHAYCGFSVGCVEGLQCLDAPIDEYYLTAHG